MSEEARKLGMVSNKMSMITIFGHKQFKPKFHNKIGYTYMMKKLQKHSISVNEDIFLQKLSIHFEEKAVVTKKCYYSNLFEFTKVYIIISLL